MRITTVPISLERLLRGQLSYMNEHGFQVIAVSSDGKPLERVCEEEKVLIIPLDMSRKIAPWEDAKAIFKLMRILRREKPMIVHTHTPKAGFVGMLAAWICRVPIRLHTVAGMPLLVHEGWKRSLLEIVERITYICATKVYPNSFEMLEIIRKLGLSTSDKLKVIANGSSNGLDSSYFDPSLFVEQERISRRTSLGISTKDFVFIFVGRLVGDKGINELVEAFCDFGCMNHVKLLLVGSYEEYLDPLRLETISLLRANPNIIEVGWQEDVRPFFAISDALVFPSYREGFPNVVMQAGAMGLPSIVTDINGCNEIIKHGVNGLIIPSRDRQALLRAMKTILDDSQLRQCMARQSRPMITSRYEQIMVWEAISTEMVFGMMFQ